MCQSNNYQKIIELGPGNIPFKLANYSVDIDGTKLKDDNVTSINCDLDVNRLDYPTNYFDFCYARHIVEDVQNPDFLFKNITDQCRAGYIETPSPLVECTYNIDGESMWKYRGYRHHRYVVWTEGNELHMMPKLPLIESVKFNEEVLERITAQSALYWNNYYWWDKDKGENPKCVMHKTFEIVDEYPDMLQRAIDASIRNSESVAKTKLNINVK